MKNRISAFLRQYQRKIGLGMVWIGVGLVYYMLTQLTPFRIPCAFHTLTGLACPGCGISRLFIRLFQLDFKGAVQENLAISCLAPLWAVMLLIKGIWHPSWLRKNSRGEQIFLWCNIGILLAFGVLRNLPGFAFLLPSALR